MPTKTIRGSNIELFRIFSAFIIMMCHSATFGGYGLPHTFNFRGLYVNTLTPVLGNLGVYSFVAIGGYFGIKSSFKASRIVKVCTITIFYALFGYVLATQIPDFTNGYKLSFKDIYYSVLSPATGNVFWYPNVYIALMLMSPWINRFLLSLTAKDFRKLLLTEYLLFSVFYTVIRANGVTSDFCVFVLVYSAAAYVRLHDCAYFKRKWLPLLVSVVGILLAAVLQIAYRHIPEGKFVYTIIKIPTA
ncbi:MAG: hypothetical protein LBN42_01760, partial [Oscillospiraceae bacterium]|nr:hypothetical protein [Oscillospiraceae bacterium]